MMSVSLAYPSNRELVGLWRELNLGTTQCVWLGHVPLHHVEALVEVRAHLQIPSLLTTALRALQVVEPATAQDLDRCWPVGAGLIAAQLQRLTEFGLVEPVNSGAWQLTESGRRAASEAANEQPRLERRSFHFVELGSTHPPAYFPLAHGLTVPMIEPREWSFSREVLAGGLRKDETWKRNQGFPTDVIRLAPGAGPLIDRAETLSAIFVDDGTWVVLPLDPRTWRLIPGADLRVGVDQEAVSGLRMLATEPTAGACQQAWADWARQRGLSESDARNCQATVEAHRLLVRPATALAERARRLPVEEEGCVLIGDQWLRRAARIQLISAVSDRLRK